MFSLLRKLLSVQKPIRRSPASRRKPQFDRLEDRVVPALNGSEFPVNLNTDNVQNEAATASAGNGMSVIAWTHSSGMSLDIRARLYNSGVAVTGDIVVTQTAFGINEFEPTVAMDATGGFVIAWTRDDFTSTHDIDVQFGRFDRFGAPVGVITDVNPTDGINLRDRGPSIAMDAPGNFVIAYSVFNGSLSFIYADMYSAGGTAEREVEVSAADNVSSLLKVNAARNAAGLFVVAYTNTDGEQLLQRYKANGKKQGKVKVVDALTDNGNPADVDLDDKGIARAVWADNNIILSRTVNKKGKMSSVVPLTTLVSGEQHFLPSIAVDRDSGDYVVAYMVTDSDPDFPESVRVREFSSANVLLNSFDLGRARQTPDVSIDALDNYLLAYDSLTADMTNPGDVMGQRGTLNP